MEHSFQLKTKKYRLPKDGVRLSFEHLMEMVAVYDILPPFSVIEDGEKDVTDDFLEYLRKNEYVFIDIKDVRKQLPRKLFHLLDSYSTKNVCISIEGKNKSISFEGSDGMKSINGFPELWKDGFTVFATLGNEEVLALENESKHIFRVSLKTKERTKIYDDCRDFIKGIIIEK